jgi:hypothetical protein
MSEKRNAHKKKPKASATRPAPRVASAKVKAVKNELAFYVTAPQLKTSISDQKPAGEAGAARFATFDEAKRAAIDALVQAIEEAEAQLEALKRSAGYDELRAAASD